MSNVDKLVKEIGKINSILKDLGVAEAVLDKEVKSFGNGGHITIPKEHVNKRVKVIIS